MQRGNSHFGEQSEKSYFAWYNMGIGSQSESSYLGQVQFQNCVDYHFALNIYKQGIHV